MHGKADFLVGRRRRIRLAIPWGPDSSAAQSLMIPTPVASAGQTKTQVESTPRKTRKLCRSFTESHKSSGTPEQLNRQQITTKHSTTLSGALQSNQFMTQSRKTLWTSFLYHWRRLSCVCPPLWWCQPAATVAPCTPESHKHTLLCWSALSLLCSVLASG